MGLADAITNRTVDSTDPRSIASKARAGRWQKLLETFPDLAEMRVLDLGGTGHFWLAAPVRPRSVTTVNIVWDDAAAPWHTHVRGDACAPPVDAAGFDLVVSNSLLEHVGGHARRRQLADVIHRAAPRHWVQTPYRYFPVEPHWMFPLFQFLPYEARVRASARWPISMNARMPRETALDVVAETELIGRSQMRHLFPASRLWMETWHGLPKSMTAILA